MQSTHTHMDLVVLDVNGGVNFIIVDDNLRVLTLITTFTLVTEKTDDEMQHSVEKRYLQHDNLLMALMSAITNLPPSLEVV